MADAEELPAALALLALLLREWVGDIGASGSVVWDDLFLEVGLPPELYESDPRCESDLSEASVRVTASSAWVGVLSGDGVGGETAGARTVVRREGYLVKLIGSPRGNIITVSLSVGDTTVTEVVWLM